MATAYNAAPTQIQTNKAASSHYPSVKAITVSDTNQDAAGPFDALWVGAAGSVKLTTKNGDTVVIVGVAAGTLLPIPCQGVWSTGTTVATPNTNILGLGH